MSVFDFDDAHPGNDPMPRLIELKEINPLFRCTLFIVPGLCTDEWLEALPDWIEKVPHGWLHPDPLECDTWTRERMLRLLDEPIVQRWFVQGWKSPGWRTSDGVYEALVERGYWIADQHLEDHRRPSGLPVYFYEDSNDRWHGHTQNVCGNGLEETWEELSGRVGAATEFSFASEATCVGVDADDPGA